MKRVEYINGKLNREKFGLREEYNGFGLYQEITPTGFYVSQSWLLVNGNTGKRLQVESYNNVCKEELLDMIDNFNDCGKFGVTAHYGGENLFVMHPCSKLKI